jgi:hypothetical protein
MKDTIILEGESRKKAERSSRWNLLFLLMGIWGFVLFFFSLEGINWNFPAVVLPVTFWLFFCGI